MSTTITLERSDLRPHDTVKGRVAWALEKVPRDLELRLCWFTGCRGTEESRTVEALPLGDTLRGERSFPGGAVEREWHAGPHRVGAGGRRKEDRLAGA